MWKELKKFTKTWNKVTNEVCYKFHNFEEFDCVQFYAPLDGTVFLHFLTQRRIELFYFERRNDWIDSKLITSLQCVYNS